MQLQRQIIFLLIFKGVFSCTRGISLWRNPTHCSCVQHTLMPRTLLIKQIPLPLWTEPCPPKVLRVLWDSPPSAHSHSLAQYLIVWDSQALALLLTCNCLASFPLFQAEWKKKQQTNQTNKQKAQVKQNLGQTSHHNVSAVCLVTTSLKANSAPWSSFLVQMCVGPQGTGYRCFLVSGLSSVLWQFGDVPPALPDNLDPQAQLP